MQIGKMMSKISKLKMISNLMKVESDDKSKATGLKKCKKQNKNKL